MDLVMPITAAFVTPYTKRFGTPVTLEATLDMLMMLPWPTCEHERQEGAGHAVHRGQVEIE